ncbi:MAG: YdaS family helix-turn-helix protein [Pseudomonadota bacterium]
MALQDDLDTPLAAAVRKAGSQSAYARIVGRSQPAIYEALRKRKQIELEDVPEIEEKLGIPRHEQRPDYFPPPSFDPNGTSSARYPAEQPSAHASRPRGEDAGGPLPSPALDYSTDTGVRRDDPLEGLAA